MATAFISLENAVPVVVSEQSIPIKVVSALVHEIRSPLTDITLSTHILKTGISDNRLTTFLDIITRGSERIDDLLKKILNSGTANEVTEEDNTVHQLLDEVLAITADSLLLKQVKVNKNYAKQNCAVVFNISQMRIAITNIVINAINAMATGQGELTFLTKAVDRGYILQIEDNGCGISKDNLENIFSPLFTKRPGGLGLGLALTHDILISNHIKVTVESELQKGTRFVLLFENPFYTYPCNS
ncbi:ATP-binding protein [Niabella aquatica]